jgi:sugar lactone lactonase YvrE
MIRVFGRVAALTVTFLVSIASAQTQPPEIARGVAWLTAQVQADGHLAGEGAAMALPLQAQSETVVTLSQLANAPSSLVARVRNASSAMSEFLARRALALAAARQAITGPITDLVAMRNVDGGFGGGVGYASDALDTALALQALAQADGADTAMAAAALTWLQAARRSDGGWGVDDRSSLYITANVLIAAQAWSARVPAAAPVAAAANDRLLALRDASGVYATSFDDAVVVIALTTRTAQPAVLQPLVDALRAAQLADGSWSDDPYLTALALRALWAASHAPSEPTTGTIVGRVVDAATAAPIAGATVQRVDATPSATSSATDGSFALASLEPGAFTVRISKVGYTSREFAVQIAAGQTLQFGTVQLARASLTADLSGTVHSNTGAALAGVIVSVGTTSALTDAAGAYALAGLNAGAATIQVTKSGYRTVTADVDFVAGQHYSFSPTLYPTNTTPPTTATVRGRVVDAATQQALAGASVTRGATTINTGSDGRFELTGLPAGAFALTIAANGYLEVTAGGSLAVGVNDIGTIGLNAVPATSTLSGLVSDAASGTPIIGASIVVEGQSGSAVSGSDGRYTLAGVSSTHISLLVTASGYLSGRFDVSLPQPGNATLDLQLTAVQASGLVFEEVAVDKPVYGPSDKIELEIEVRNTTDAAAELIVDADVRDPQGNVVYVFRANAHGAGQFPPNLPLTFAAASTMPVEMEWAAQRLVAGNYTIYARGTDAAGHVQADGSAQFVVRSEPVLRGGVTPDPPLAQAGTNVPVHITANLINVGNEAVPAGPLNLSVVLQNADQDTSTVPQTNVTPIASGTPYANARGLVGDAQGNLYTVNSSDRKVLRIDAQTHAAGVLATALDAPSGIAVDAGGTVYVASTAKRISVISPAGAVTSINATRITNLSAIDTDANGDLVLAGSFSGTEDGVPISGEQRLVRRAAADGSETLLWRNGLSQPIGIVKDDDGNFIVGNYADNTLAKVTPQGAVTPFARGLNRPYGITRDAAGNVYAANSGNGTIARVAPDGEVVTWASGLQNPTDLRFDAAGTLYVANQGNDSIVAIAPDGQQRVFAKGVANQPQGMKYDAAGNLYVANDDGSLRRKAPDGSVETVAIGLSGPRGLAFAADGAVLVANRSDGTIARIDDSGKSTFASGLANPYGVALDADGNVDVTENGANRIRRYAADGTPIDQVETMLHNPGQTRIDAQGRVFVANADFITVIEGGTPRILVRAFAASAIAVDPVNGGLLAIRSRDIYRIALDGTATKLVTLAFTPYDAVVDAVGTIVVRDYSGKRLQTLDAGGAATVLVTLPDYPSHLVADLAGHVYVRLNNKKLYGVAADGALTEIVYSLNETFSALGFGMDGQMLVWTTSNRVYTLDPATAAVTRIRDAVSGVSGVTRDGAGNLLLAFSAAQELDTYDSAGVFASRLDGFLTPWDLLADGAALKFVDSGGRFYSLVPGGYPIKLGTFNVTYLAKAGADILGTASGRIVRWNGSGQTDHAGVSGSTLKSVAGLADGRFAGGDTAASRVIEFNASRGVVADYAGIVRPQGLAFDAQGRLHVANYGSGTVARLDANGVATMVTTVSTPRYLAFDGNGDLWITRSSGVTRVTPAGVASTVGDAVNMQGLIADAGQVVGVDQTYSTLRRLTGANWTPFAAGLSNPTTLRSGAGDAIYVANRNSNTIVEYHQGRLDTVAVNLTAIDSIGIVEDGTLYVGRDSGLVNRVATDGTVEAMRIQGALASAAVYGVAGSSQQLYVLAGAGALYGVRIMQATTPPPVGTIVHTAQVPMAAMLPGDDYTSFDFGDWLPPYGGDFRITVSRDGVAEPAVNYVHVGPHADGELVALRSELPPGDQTLPMCMNLTGADFTSISRVEVDQVRRLASISTPNGMAADRAGNVYYTDSTHLYRTDTQGATTTLLSGLATAFGLAADSNENLYFTNRSGAGSTYQLIRVDRNGQQSTLANLGVTRANGVAVNSRDEILVGTAGKLLKVLQDGTTSIVTTTGLPDPRGVAIDGHDNVYVQNNSGYVSEIHPDGSVTDLYTSNNGIQDPYFEGDGYPNIAADCADNLYVASYQWNDMGVTATEEHKIAQIVSRTGHAAVLFDTLNVNSIINDIDYLAFDRFGSRLMMYNDYEHMIWQVPVTCGAIGVDAHILTVPGQSITAATRAPAAVVPQADGRTEYVWSLSDVSADGDGVCFDTNLRGLALGEQRKSVDSAFIDFRNSFSTDDVTLPVGVPVIQVANLVGLGVATDRAEYHANETVQIATTLTNANATTIAGALAVEIYDSHGVRVATVQQQDATIPANGEIVVDGTFAVGTILAGGYEARATLSDNGLVLARGDAAFAVLAEGTQALATSQVATDRLSYQPTDRVVISSRAISLSSNVILENLALTVQVYDADDVLQFTQGHAIAQLLPGAHKDYTANQPLHNAHAGIYTVRQTLADAGGHVLDTQQTQYQVGSSGETGFGLVGALSADPVDVTAGTPVQLDGAATNRGNADMHAVPLTLALVDPVQGNVLWSWDTTADIAVDATVPVVQAWPTDGVVEGTYVALLRAHAGGQDRVLAQTTVHVSAPPIHLDASVTMAAQPRLSALVLVDPAAVPADRNRVALALDALGYSTAFATTADEFDAGLRSGAHRAYLLLAPSVALAPTTERLLREAVHRGDGLVVGDGRAALSEALAQTNGLAPGNALTPIDLAKLVIAPDAPGGAATLVATPPLPARTVAATTATVLAELQGRYGNAATTGTLAQAVADRLRVDVFYGGSDAGTNGSHLSLASVGRLHDAQGHDRYTVWRIRNSGASARTLSLASAGDTWSLPLVVSAQVDAFVASPVVAGSAEHRLLENGISIESATAVASVFDDARIVDIGDNPGAIALWANSGTIDYGLEWTGSQHQSYGAIHANSGMRIAGAQNLIDGPVHYVTRFDNSGSQNTFTSTPRAVTPQPLPQLIDLDDYRPGGAVQAALGAAYLDQSAECASKHRWQRSGSQVSLAPGVYWIPCDVKINGSRASGTVTLVSTGSIELNGSSATFEPYYRGLQFATTLAGDGAVKLATSSLTLGGLVFAPAGELQASGSNSLYRCSLIADTIRLAGAKTTIDPRQCAWAGIERRAPAVTWNAYGSGWSSYAAFDWSRGLDRFDSAAAFGQLFAGVLDRSSPDEPTLRSGTQLSLAVEVHNLGDAFGGVLALATSGDAVITVPGTPQWLLDLAPAATFDGEAIVQLGSGTSTSVAARVAALTPLAIDPLAQASLSIAHVAGETLAALATDLAGLSGRDAALDAALAALQAAQSALAGGDRTAGVSALLDAAEAAGRSAHAQAGAYRTRIDWVLWRESR